LSFARWICAALLACGCEATEEHPAAPAPEVIYGGCVEFGPGTCILEGPTALSVWLDVSPATPLLVRIDGVAVPATGRAIPGGGLRLEVKVPEGADVVQVETPEQAWSPQVELVLEWRTRPPIDDLSPEELRAFVKKSSGWGKLRALERLRRMSKGNALVIGESELELARELEAVRHQTMVLAHRAHNGIEVTHDHEQAQEALAQLKALSESSPFAAARWQYYNAVFARRSGDLGTAIAGLEEARTLSERLNFGVPNVVGMLANTLAELGRGEEARALFRQRESELWQNDPGCSEWLRVANNLAWGHLVLAAAGLEHDDPRPLLLAALEQVNRCPHPRREAALLLDLALAELEYDRPLDAQGWLAHLRTIPSDYRGWVETVASAAAVQHGDESNQRPLILRPIETTDFELTWNQNVRRGDLLAMWGFDALAAEAYLAAERQLSATFEQVGTKKGGELYLAGRSASLRGLVDSLVRMGRPAEASCAVRLARAREFARLDRTARLAAATPEERTRWTQQVTMVAKQRRAVARVRAGLWELPERRQAQASATLAAQARRNQRDLDAAIRGLGLEPNARSCSELRSPSPGEVILVASESHVFALSESEIEMSPRSDLSSLETLASASLISLVGTGTDAAEPLHLMPWRHVKSLMDLAPLGHSLDLPPRPTSALRGRTALVLADPRDDLPSARAEADRVGQVLGGKGWKVIDVRGSAATRSSLVEHASTVDLLHYAGHGVRSGVSGWDSALLLADNGRFGVHDVFTLPGVPPGVVLTGCETAASSPDTVGGGMNIGRAFVLAGSDWVIAADAEVADRFAADVGAAVHRSQAKDGPTRLREALLHLREANPELPWQQFRVITP